MARDYQFHMQVTGSTGNPAVLLLHGFLGRGRDWLEVMQRLADRYYCLAPDLPGHGRTKVIDGEDAYGMEGISEALAGVLKELKIEKVDLIGYSMGGRLALYLALRYRERVLRLVLESGSPGLAEEEERSARREQDERLARRLETEPFERFLADWYDQPIFTTLRRNKPWFERLMQQRRDQDPLGLARSLRRMGTGVQESLWDELGQAPPALLIVGAEDTKFKRIAGEMAAMMPAAEVATVAGAGHNVHFEAPERFVQIVREFLIR